MGKPSTVISLDPIDRTKQIGFIGRLFITTYHGGASVYRSEPFGHYMFCGKQRSGKTASVLWFAQRLSKKYSRKRKRLVYENEHGKLIKFDKPPKLKFILTLVLVFISKNDIFDLIDKLNPYVNEVRIFLIDEFHTYFPKGSTSKEDKETLTQLTNVFSQLAKRNVYVLSTAQVYGRLDKVLREQCLYMVNNRVSMHKRIVSEFILESDIICDDLGRWAGRPTKIMVHGLSKVLYDTKRLIRS